MSTEERDARKQAEAAEALEKALEKLERQAQQTQKSLQTALQLPEAEGLAEQLEQVSQSLDKQIETRGQLLEMLQSLTAQQDRQTEGSSAAAATDKNLAAVRRSLAAANRELAATMNQNGDAAAHFSEVINSLNDSSLPPMADKIAKAKKSFDEFNTTVQAGAEEATSLRQSVFGLSEGPLKSLADRLSQGKGGLKGFASEALKGKINMKALGTGIAEIAQDSLKFALEQDKVFAAFRKSTGAGKEFNQMIKSGEEAGRSYGVTLGEASAAVGALKNTFTEFTYLAPNVQKDIMDTTLVLGEMGLDAQTSADFFQIAHTSMGMGLQETNQAMLDLAATAQGLGVDVNKMGQDFVANREILSRYGSKGVEVFKDMAVQAKATGIEVGTLIGFVDQFKTFDQAGTSVGRLNAIMGGPFLNSIDMLNASMEDPVEGIRMMKSAIDQAGISAENLSGAEVMAFSDALGLSAEDTRKMLSESSEQLDKRTMDMKEAADQTMKMQSVNEKLANAFKQLYLDAEPFLTNFIIPLVDKFASLMKWLGDADSSMSQLGRTAIFVATAFAALMMAVPGMQPFAAASLAILGGLAVASVGTAEPSEGNLSKPTSLKGYSQGGRHTATRASQQMTGTASAPRSSSVGVVGENGPELAELGTAAQVSTASTTERLTRAMENMSAALGKLPDGGQGGDTQLSVSIAGEKIEELVIKSLRSPRARNALGPYVV